MSQVITNAFEQYWQSSLAAEQPVVLDEFILADIPNLDITSPIDPDAGLPPESQIVHRQNVDQRGRINTNAVAYSIVMDTTVGDFSFNAMYLRNKANGVIGMIVYKGRETKLKTDQTTGQTGNSLVKSMLMGYDQAAEATLTNVDAGTWQIDYAARLRGQDEDLRQLASQLYGHHTFIGDGFKVVQQDGDHQVTQGVAIVGGLRIELKQPEVIYPGTKPIGVWVDVHRSGSLLSEHQNHFTIITSVADLTDHVDESGYPHYVAKLGTLDLLGAVDDERGVIQNAGNLGETRHLWARSLAEAGYHLVDGSFESGAFLAKRNDAVLFESNGKCFVWAGEFPSHGIDIPKKSTPESTGGVLWRYVDESLREELFAGPIVERNGVAALRDFISIHEFGVVFDNETDNTYSLNKAFQSGKKIWIPDPGEGNFAMASGTVYYDSRTIIMGPGKYRPVIKAAASMPGELDLLAPINETFSTFSYLRNILMFDLCVDANGFNRTKTVGHVGEWGRGIRVGAIFDSMFVRVNVIGGPQHGIDVACWKDNYIGIGHAGVAVGRPFNVVLSECDSTDWVYDDGITTHGCYNVLIEKHTSRITDAAKAAHTYTATQKGIEIDDGSVGVVITKPRVYGNGTHIMAFSVATHAYNPASYDIQWDSPWAHGCEILYGAWADTATDATFDTPNWKCRNVRVNNLTYIKPTLDPGTTFPSRFLAFQGFTDCYVDGISIHISDADGSYDAPASSADFLNVARIYINDVKATGVPGVPSGSYSFARDTGWFRVGLNCSEIYIDGISLDNVGYMNRIINDTAASAVRVAKRIKCAAIPSDGQTKTAIFSNTADAEYKDFVLPSGMVPYRTGRTNTAYPAGNYRFNQLTPEVIIGGLEIRSEALSGGAQAKPGIIFNRQFASSSDPTGTLGKGCVSFRTTAASEGRFSITAFHEDTGEFRPVMAVRSHGGVKAILPVGDNDTTVGDASNRCSIGYFAQGVQTTSDASLKSAVRPMTDSELSASVEISQSIGIFTWLREDSDRLHCGTTVQRIIEIMSSHGLNAFEYSFVCHDAWEDQYQDIYAEVIGDDGVAVDVPTGERILVQPAGEIYTLRDHELYKFLVRGLEHRLSRIENI